jgi:hypothetical protein
MPGMPIHMVSGTDRNKNPIRINVCMEPDGVMRFQARWNLSNPGKGTPAIAVSHRAYGRKLAIPAISSRMTSATR